MKIYVYPSQLLHNIEFKTNLIRFKYNTTTARIAFMLKKKRTLPFAITSALLADRREFIEDEIYESNGR